MTEKLKYKLLIIILIIIISILHYLTGNSNSAVHNFYKLLYYIPIILASFYFGFKGGILTSIIISFIYSPHILLYVGFRLETINELLDIILFFTVGIVIGVLVEKKNMGLLKLDEELNRYIILENYTKSIIESIQSGVIAINKDMLITMMNQGAAKILEIQDHCIGQSLIEVFSDSERIKEKIIEVLEQDRTYENIEITINKNNKHFVIKISLFPLTAFESIGKGAVVIIDDITEIKQLQQQLWRNEKLAALGEISSGIAHEIRNPLAIIKAIEQTMKKELSTNTEAVNELDIIDEEIERANRIIKALMEFGKPSRFERKYHSLNTIIENILIIVSKYTQQHDVNIEFLKDNIPDILVDEEQLKQAFINIIINSVQAVSQQGKLSISTLNIKNEWVKVVFKDNGTGIEENDLEKIFNPFFTTKDEGTGLGLSIVQRIIDEHNGRVEVFSKVGEGTRFEILFPIKKGENDEKDINS